MDNTGPLAHAATSREVIDAVALHTKTALTLLTGSPESKAAYTAASRDRKAFNRKPRPQGSMILVNPLLAQTSDGQLAQLDAFEIPAPRREKCRSLGAFVRTSREAFSHMAVNPLPQNARQVLDACLCLCEYQNLVDIRQSDLSLLLSIRQGHLSRAFAWLVEHEYLTKRPAPAIEPGQYPGEPIIKRKRGNPKAYLLNPWLFAYGNDGDNKLLQEAIKPPAWLEQLRAERPKQKRARKDKSAPTETAAHSAEPTSTAPGGVHVDDLIPREG